MSDETQTETWEQQRAREIAETRAHELARDKAWLEQQAVNMAAEREAIERVNDERQAKAEKETWARLREQTAATILAALITSYDAPLTNSALRAGVEQAVELTDALRAALKGTP